MPIKPNNAKTAIKTLLHHWIIKFGPPIYLVNDRGSEYVNKEMAHLCTLMGILHSSRTAYSPWTNGLVEVQNRNLCTHLRMFYMIHLKIGHSKSTCTSFFNRTLSKPIPQETAMLQIYSTVYENTLQKINSHAYITKTYHEGKPLPIGIFVSKRNFTHVHFSDKLKPLRIGPYKIIDRLSDVTYELLAQDGSTIHVHRNHLIPYYPKEPLLYPHLRSFMRFSDTTQFPIPQPTKYANSDSSESFRRILIRRRFSNIHDTIHYRRFFSNIYDTIQYFQSKYITSNHKSLTPPNQ